MPTASQSVAERSETVVEPVKMAELENVAGPETESEVADTDPAKKELVIFTPSKFVGGRLKLLTMLSFCLPI